MAGEALGREGDAARGCDPVTRGIRSLLKCLVVLPVLCCIAGCTPSLHDVIGLGDMELAAQMLAADPALAASENELGKQPLQYAVYYNQAEALDLLRDAGADLNAADKTGMTALHVAARFGRRATLWLLAQGVDFQRPDVFGDLPSHTAAIYGQDRVIKALHKAGDPLTTKNEAGLTPAALARKYRQEETAVLIESLVENQS